MGKLNCPEPRLRNVTPYSEARSITATKLIDLSTESLDQNFEASLHVQSSRFYIRLQLHLILAATSTKSTFDRGKKTSLLI